MPSPRWTCSSAAKFRPIPQFYELLYTYATGVNPSLNQRINQIFRDGTATQELAERLYNEFLKAQDANERISSVTERMATSITAVHEAIDGAMTTASSYSGTLEAATRRSGRRPRCEAALRRHGAAAARRNAAHAGRQPALEPKLESSREDITALQRDLDEVRRDSMLDPLTKIFNRKSFDERMLTAFAEARNTASRSASSCSTSITSSASTIPGATRPATRCCGSSP